MKIALVHDYLIEAGGAERVLRVLSDMYPEAPIYTALAKNGTAKAMFGDHIINESALAPFLKIGHFYSYFRFLIPWVWRSIDLSDYDLVITSCSGYISRGFRVRDATKVVAYCHTPPRWLYGYDTPTGANKKWWGSAFMWIVGPFMHYFDYQSAQRVDVWVANSKEVARRIEKFYRKKAIVVYPPVATEGTSKRVKHNHVPADKQKYYLLVSRIVGGKGIAEAASAFKEMGILLKIVGEVVDPNLAKSVESLGRVDDSELADLYEHAQGFVALARDEDFGMTVVEAMSHGTPVIAYRGGGYLETVKEGESGVLVEATSTQAIAQAIAKMEKKKWDRAKIKSLARRFGRAKFEDAMRELIGE